MFYKPYSAQNTSQFFLFADITIFQLHSVAKTIICSNVQLQVTDQILPANNVVKVHVLILH